MAVTVAEPGEQAALSFTAQAGQRVSLEISGVTIGPTADHAGRISLLAVDGDALAASSLRVTSDVMFIDTESLPVAGEHSILIDRDGALTGSVTLRLFDVPPDPVAEVSIDGSPVTVTTTTPGQNALLTFTASAGQRVTITVTNLSIGPTRGHAGRVSLLDADQESLEATSLRVTSDRAQIVDVTLSSAGTYTTLIDPDEALTDSATVSVTTAP